MQNCFFKKAPPYTPTLVHKALNFPELWAVIIIICYNHFQFYIEKGDFIVLIY